MKDLTTLVRILWTLSLALLLAACGSEGGDGPADAGTGPAAVSVVANRDLGSIETAPTIRGRDGGYSGVFAGRSVWLYGDTFLQSPGEDDRNFLSNTWSWTDDFAAEDGILPFSEAEDGTGAPTEFLPHTEEEWAFNRAHLGENCQEAPCGARWALWPGPLVADPERDRALVFYQKVYAEPGSFNFYGVGHALAVWSEFDQTSVRPVLRPDAEHPTLLFAEDEPGFGSAALAVGNLLYAYACDPVDLVKPCRVARVPLADALDRSAWRFFAGDGEWVPEVERARALFHGNDIMMVSHLPFRDVYLALYSQPLDTHVMIRTAPSPEGPWSAPVPAFPAQAPTNPEAWVYDALAHAESAQEGGRVQYVTYSRETGFLASEVRLVELELQ